MRYILSFSVISDDGKLEEIKDSIELGKSIEAECCIGISLAESHQVLKWLQKNIVIDQAQKYIAAHNRCDNCNKKLNLKDYRPLQYKTLFGTVMIPSPRFKSCKCTEHNIKTFTPLANWLPEKNSPELLYFETKLASLMSFEQASKLLKELFPVRTTENASTIHNHLQNIAKRQEAGLMGKLEHITEPTKESTTIYKPDKPITVGIDGAHLKKWHNKNTTFEVIIGKVFAANKTPKRFGLVQVLDKHPKQRMLDTLYKQGMQTNQQINFLGDGAEEVRSLQQIMHPEAEHRLDWFHITMKLTVMNNCAKGLIKSDPVPGKEVQKKLEKVKWYLWHGNIEKARMYLADCYYLSHDEVITYENKKRFLRYIKEFDGYIIDNCELIVNYGELYRNNETISTAFVESGVNELVSKRMAKKQQTQWTYQGAHNILQTRSAVLNDDLREHFKRWYPSFSVNKIDEPTLTDS